MAIVPFRIDVADEVLADLRARLSRTRWPDEVAGSGWLHGVPRSWLRELCDYWADGFDWRAVETWLNRWPQFRADLDGVPVHFVRIRGRGPAPLPLVITVGWPSTFAEVLPIVAPLVDPGGFGGNPADAFDVVVPSIPGFGFSSPYERGGLLRIDDLWARLMTELGYERFAAAGSDLGARVTTRLGVFHADRMIGLHFSSPDLALPDPLPSRPTAQERAYLDELAAWSAAEGAYAELQKTKPQTLAYGLTDSPAALAAWILEKFHTWSDDFEVFSRDDLLTTATIYWVTGTANSAARFYYEARHDPEPLLMTNGRRVDVPTGVLTFPNGAEPNIPRSLVERVYDLRRWTDETRGGHFPAFETPQLMIDDLRAFFRPLR